MLFRLKTNNSYHVIEAAVKSITTKLTPLFFVLSALAGCAYQQQGRPPVSYYNVTSEMQLKSAKHWRVVANDIAAKVQSQQLVKGTRLFIKPNNPDSLFDRVFSAQLKSSLFDAGIPVSSVPEGALQVSISAVTVRHVAELKYVPGSLTALAAGVAVLRESANKYVGTVIGADALASIVSMTDLPDTELVLTTAIERDGLYVLHSTDTYYVDGVDFCLFKPLGRDKYAPLIDWNPETRCKDLPDY